mgnify:CR=1 FL=1
MRDLEMRWRKSHGMLEVWASLAVALMGASSVLPAQASREPLNRDELFRFVAAGLTEKRIETITSRRCLAFTVGPEAIARLRLLGAGPALIDALAKTCRRALVPRLRGVSGSYNVWTYAWSSRALDGCSQSLVPLDAAEPGGALWVVRHVPSDTTVIVSGAPGVFRADDKVEVVKWRGRKDRLLTVRFQEDGEVFTAVEEEHIEMLSGLGRDPRCRRFLASRNLVGTRVQ